LNRGVRTLSTYDERVFNEQIFILKDFLYHYGSYKCILEEFDNLITLKSKEFWAFTVNAHYFQAVNLWCMVFGVDSNETHWRNLGLKEEFRPSLLSSLNLNDKDYRLYWSSVIDWRNQYLAHRVPGYLEKFPDLKLARSVVFAYEEWIGSKIDDIGFSLEIYEERSKQELKEYLSELK
jgi:hypothetical protein